MSLWPGEAGMGASLESEAATEVGEGTAVMASQQKEGRGSLRPIHHDVTECEQEVVGRRMADRLRAKPVRPCLHECFSFNCFNGRLSLHTEGSQPRAGSSVESQFRLTTITRRRDARRGRREEAWPHRAAGWTRGRTAAQPGRTATEQPAQEPRQPARTQPRLREQGRDAWIQRLSLATT